MQKVSIIVLGILLIAPLSFGGENGEILFKSMGCMSCHHPEKASKINPSLVDIAQAYQGKQPQLIGYLNGQEEAIVKPEKAGYDETLYGEDESVDRSGTGRPCGFHLGALNLFAWIHLGDGQCLNSEPTSDRDMGCRLVPNT